MASVFKGIGWVAGVYFYFLIFAQFAFLAILEQRGLAAESLKLVMGFMAAGGIAGSVLTLPLRNRVEWLKLLRVAAVSCSVMPMLAAYGASSWTVPAYAAIALGIGLSLGSLTVLLSANLAKIMKYPYIGAGIGTGIAYMLSNVPWIFSSSPTTQCYLTAVVIFIVVLIPMKPVEKPVADTGKITLSSFPVGLLWFTMLVWLDSAAFYIIQHNQEMKAFTWGEPYLWRNAAVHLVAAIFSGWLIWKRQLIPVLLTAFVLLASAGLMASHVELSQLAGFLYPIGVSFYSVGLILYPAVWLRKPGKMKRTVILLAVAGWVGSTLGIGMAQDLREVPLWFVIIAASLMVTGYFWKSMMARKRELLACGVVLSVGLSWGWFTKVDEAADTSDLVSRGREVYISEGCIHCHSRYVRPNSRDVELWGPVAEVESITEEQPVLIGNRRQGPDLLNVGLRRSKSWLKQHFIDPRSLIPESSMPSYAHLFKDERGEALVAYLSSYEAKTIEKRMNMIQQWSPQSQSEPASLKAGEHLFSKHCVMCHGNEARGDGRLTRAQPKLWLRPPTDLVAGPFLLTSSENNAASISRAIKFGIVGTDMPGHELLSDAEISDLSAYVRSLRSKLTQ